MPSRPTPVKTPLLALAALVPVVALSVSSCGDEEPTTMAQDDASAAVTLDDLDGLTFASVRVEGRRLVDGTEVRLGFDGDALSADAGCNHLFGTVAIDGDTLTAAGMGGTEMGCPDGRGEQDAWLTAFLTDGVTAALDGDTLTLSGDGVVLELVGRETPEPPVGDDPDQPTSDEGVVVEGE